MRILLAIAALFIATQAPAASLRVAPVLIDLRAPARAATLTLQNMQQQGVDVQIRVFRWRQKDGRESLDPTTDVVVSPPIIKLEPGVEQVVRVVRTATQAVTGEESYRVIVDELPAPSRRRDGTVALLLRYSIPVFFADRDGTDPKIAWRIERTGTAYTVSATNAGAKRLRVANMTLKDTRGATLARQDGLVGYVLGGSSTRFTVRALAAGAPAGAVTLAAESDAGPFHATVTPRATR